MANRKKYNYAAEQARKRNAEKAKYRAEAAKRKAWWEANGQKTITIAVIALVVVLAFWVVCRFFFGPGGSIPNFFGNLRGVEENWLVGNVADDGRTPRYFKLATYEAPEGYVESEFSAHSDELVKDMYFSDESKEQVIQDVYLSHVQGMTGEEQLANLSLYAMNMENSGAQKGTIAGYEADYMYIVFDQAEISGEGTAYATLCCYFETPYDAVVSAMINSRTVESGTVPSLETMLAEADKMLADLELVQ